MFKRRRLSRNDGEKYEMMGLGFVETTILT